MENTTQPVQKLSDVAKLLLEKLKADQTDITLDFQDVSVQGPGPQGTPGQWKLNGTLTLKTKSTGTKQP
ncbi:hypothetical protein [Rufibacter tibetensis]|uniref:Uncharacterized protein n=1 Tax=Rufibacter tibetensis TaxID=512763 RepID=A0A0P0CSG2_9BACT|nr:hypothetical protein [Rufibacter tibetensis]ALJ00394.1 hypothetical protein DC20_17220 [Rufibacter tibetensis]